MVEDIKMITEGFAFTGFDYRESTLFSDMDETIIREAELNTLTFENNLFRIYNDFGLSSKKCKRDVDICRCDFSVSVAWKKNITDFSSRATIVVNESLLNKPI